MSPERKITLYRRLCEERQARDGSLTLEDRFKCMAQAQAQIIGRGYTYSEDEGIFRKFVERSEPLKRRGLCWCRASVFFRDSPVLTYDDWGSGPVCTQCGSPKGVAEQGSYNAAKSVNPLTSEGAAGAQES